MKRSYILHVFDCLIVFNSSTSMR